MSKTFLVKVKIAGTWMKLGHYYAKNETEAKNLAYNDHVYELDENVLTKNEWEVTVPKGNSK